MAEETNNEENMTMDDLSKAVDDSFTTFKDEGQANWENLKKLMDEKTTVTVTVEENSNNKGVVTHLEGVRGFIPASRLALRHVDDLNEYIGKEIEARVIELDEQKNRLILSCREILREKADAERAEKIAATQVGTVMEGTVENIKPYGAFIDLGDGLSGLVHVSQISRQRIKSPDVVLKVGDKVKVKVIAIKDGKLSLSMKALQGNGREDDREDPELRNIKLPKSEDLTTNLGSLLKNIKLDQ